MGWKIATYFAAATCACVNGRAAFVVNDIPGLLPGYCVLVLDEDGIPSEGAALFEGDNIVEQWRMAEHASKFFAPVTNAASAEGFLESLASAGILFHPDDDPADIPVIGHFPDTALEILRGNMNATFAFIDPYDFSLLLMGKERS